MRQTDSGLGRHSVSILRHRITRTPGEGGKQYSAHAEPRPRSRLGTSDDECRRAVPIYEPRAEAREGTRRVASRGRRRYRTSLRPQATVKRARSVTPRSPSIPVTSLSQPAAGWKSP